MKGIRIVLSVLMIFVFTLNLFGWEEALFTWDAPMLKWENALRPNQTDDELKTQIMDFYKAWRDGDHTPITADMLNDDGTPKPELVALYEKYDVQSSNRTPGPGYIKKFKLPEVHKLPGETTGSDMGYVVAMYGNGDFDIMCASTSESMAYGMIITALMGDKETFDGLWRVVDYYNAIVPGVNGNDQVTYKEVDGLTSWLIPAEYGLDVRTADWYIAMSDAMKAAWEGGGNDVVYRLPKWLDAEQTIMVGAEKSTATCFDSAADGDLDIAYALTLAKEKWGRYGDRYFNAACDRFNTIFSDELVYGVGEHSHTEVNATTLFYPTGAEARTISWGGNLPDIENSRHTRPCDWMLTHFRTYYKFAAAKGATDMVNSIYSQVMNLRDPNTNLLPDFGIWKPAAPGSGDYDTIVPCPDGMHPDEGTTDAYYYNACRFPFRMGVDYMHFGDERSKELALGVVDFVMNRHNYQANIGWFGDDPSTTTSGDGLPKSGYNIYTGDPLVPIYIEDPNNPGQMIENPDGSWPSPEYTSPIVLGAACGEGDTYQSFLNEGWQVMKDSFNGSFYNFEWATGNDRAIMFDPYHSGYYGDCITLMCMLALSGNWVIPEAYRNEFEGHNHDVANNIDGWKLETAGNCDATIGWENGRVKVTVTTVDTNEDAFGISLVRDDMDETSSWNYVLAANIERVDANGVSVFDGKLTNADSSVEANLADHKKVVVSDHSLFPSTSYQAYGQGFFEKSSGDRYTIFKLGLNSEVSVGTVIYLDNFSLTDPPWEVARYRYVGEWTEDFQYEPGDYVRYKFMTYECQESHLSEAANNPEDTEGSVWTETTYAQPGPEWDPTLAYIEGDIVNYNGRGYVCKITHVSAIAPPLNTNAWMLYYDPYARLVTNWTSGVYYTVGTYVNYNDKIYECSMAHNSIATWNPEAAHTLWTMNNNPFTEVVPAEWEPWTQYATGYVVEVNGATYECIVGHMSQPGWEPSYTGSLWRKM